MNSRLKVFGVIAILGFLAGIIAQVTATYFIPWFMSVLPLLGQRNKLPHFRIRRRNPNQSQSLAYGHT